MGNEGLHKNIGCIGNHLYKIPRDARRLLQQLTQGDLTLGELLTADILETVLSARILHRIARRIRTRLRLSRVNHISVR